MLLALPSGFGATVCSPTLRSLLSGMTLAEAALATPGLAADDLSEADRYVVDSWAARRLADDPESGPFAELCAAFGCRPSAELGVTDSLHAFFLDNALLGTLAGGKSEAEEHSESRVRFTTGGPT